MYIYERTRSCTIDARAAEDFLLYIICTIIARAAEDCFVLLDVYMFRCLAMCIGGKTWLELLP